MNPNFVLTLTDWGHQQSGPKAQSKRATDKYRWLIDKSAKARYDGTSMIYSAASVPRVGTCESEPEKSAAEFYTNEASTR